MEVIAGIPDAWLQELPADWTVAPLSRLAQVRTGVAKNVSAAVTDPIYVHYLRVANVQDGYLNLAEMSTIAISRSDLQRYSVLPGDVLMNEGGDRDKLGRGAIWRGEFAPCIHQNHVFVVRCGPEVSPEYLNIWSASATARRYFLLAGKQTTNLASINKTALGLLPVALPPLHEQKAIAHALSDVGELIQSLERLIAKKRSLKQAAMQQLLTGQTRLAGYRGQGLTKTSTGPYPHGWRSIRIKELGKWFSGSTPAMKNPRYWQGQTPWVSPKDMKCLRIFDAQDHISGEAITDGCRVLPAGTILMVIRGMILAHSFPVAKAERPLACNQDIKAVVVNDDVNSDFVLYWLALHSQHLLSLATESTHGTKRLPPEMLFKEPIFLPPLSEQRAISEVLSDMDAEITALEARLAKTRDLKQGMMQELLTGRKRLV